MWLFRVAELFSYNFQTVLHFADEVYIPLCNLYIVELYSDYFQILQNPSSL
jgi:hypothetical protein